jgi:hypothetical protein
MIHAFPCCSNGFIEAQPTPPLEYLQTNVERFRNFIIAHQAAAQMIEGPLKERMACPVCGGIMFLLNEPLAYSVEGYAWSGKHHYYECGKCNERFTTTDSDTLSIASLEPIESSNINA